MSEFVAGQKYLIPFGTTRREATVVEVTSLKVVVSIDLGGRHPLLSAFSRESFEKKVKEAE